MGSRHTRTIGISPHGNAALRLRPEHYILLFRIVTVRVTFCQIGYGDEVHHRKYILAGGSESVSNLGDILRRKGREGHVPFGPCGGDGRQERGYSYQLCAWSCGNGNAGRNQGQRDWRSCDPGANGGTEGKR